MSNRLTFKIPENAVKVHVFLDDNGDPKAEFETGVPVKKIPIVKKVKESKGILGHLKDIATGGGIFADPEPDKEEVEDE